MGRRKKFRKNRYECQITIHHIIPISRGGTDRPENKIEIPRYLHDAYHKLFGNSTPDEVLDHLIRTWFKKGKKRK